MSNTTMLSLIQQGILNINSTVCQRIVQYNIELINSYFYDILKF